VHQQDPRAPWGGGSARQVASSSTPHAVAR
jgi:hypothetical protein